MYQFAATQQISTAKSIAFFQKFYEIVHTLRVNETKVLSIKDFIGNCFVL